MIGKTYFLRGEPVTVILRGSWAAGRVRNVLIERADGSRHVRPFRGLRVPPPGPVPTDATEGHEA